MPPPLPLLVDVGSGVPIYRQVLDQLRAQALGGRLPEGQFLPSVRAVAEQLQVNPMTISKAYSLLEREGVLELVRGQGMRVRRPPGNGEARLEVLRPMLRQVAATARQLGLSREKVLAELKSILEER